MSELSNQQVQSNSLISSSSDKILIGHKDADYNSVEAEKDKTELFKDVSSTTCFIKRPEVRNFFYKMYIVLKELVIVSLMALTYAALMNDAPKISKSPAAFPFFPHDSIVNDWYHGELSEAIDKARESDIAFVMFYAPWDAESQAVRAQFDLAARYMGNEVSFAAINCWQPGSECRKQYSKAYSWPVLIAYPTHGKGIQYKGPNTAHYMVKFLKSFTRPLVRIDGESDVDDLLSNHDAVVVGCVDAKPGSIDYAVFYNTALRFLEKDPVQETVFAIISDLNNEYCIENSPSMALHMWNETLLYASDDWKSTSLLTWIISNLHQVSAWITPLGSKSLTLSAFLHPGPALILFTPRNPLNFFVDYYDLLHEVGLEYYNCGNMLHVHLHSLHANAKRKENRHKYSDLMKSCSLRTTVPHVKRYPSVVTYTLPQKWANHSCCLANSKVSPEKCFDCDPVNILNERLELECHHFDNCNGHSTTNYRAKNENCYGEDSRSAGNLLRRWKKEKCRIAHLARQFHPVLLSESVRGTEDVGLNVSGLACKLNSSLVLIALDSLRYYHFAERLGIDISQAEDKTAAVIINQKMEAHHILYGPVNDRTLREFIINFTSSSLPRALDSETTIKRRSRRKGVDQRQKSTLVELNTDTFFPIVMQDNKAVIVFYYSKQCSFCSGISYTLLTVAKMLKGVISLQFARLDGDLNILPWAFTLDSYPTVILFPMKRKSESRIFPRDISVTVPNLINFILVNLNPSLKLHVMWTLCNQTKFEDEKLQCVASVRKENLFVIDNTLRAWRRTDLLSKKKLLYRLQQLRNINMLLAHSSHDASRIELCLNRLHFIPTDDVQISLDKKKFVHDEL